MTALVEIKGLSKRFLPTAPAAIQDLSASIPQGEIVGLVGPDGAGKTTLIRLMAALLKPTAGTITLEGYDTMQASEQIHYLTGYMPQRFGLYEDLSVLQNLTLYADLRGVLGKQRSEKFEKLLEFTGLKPFQARLARHLSGGMKQKLGLACALIKTPHLLLLDEPSVGVDPLSRQELWNMVQKLRGEGISILWSTAYLEEAQLCDRVLLLNEGQLLYQGPPSLLTQKMEGRVFKLTPHAQAPRALLTSIIQHPDVLDAVLQGRGIRIVTRALQVCPNLWGEVVPQSPRFEDAFLALLGGGPKIPSQLAARMPPVAQKEGAVIVAEGLTKKFDGFVAADTINCSVNRGEIFGLLGPNGAGKSTIFKMLCGLLRPTQGIAYVNGLNLQDAPAAARAQIGYMAQKFSLYGNLSVRSNLEFFSGIYNLKGKEQKEAIDKMLDIFNLYAYQEVATDLLPLGLKQRLSLACATLHAPPILFLDEPTSGVDPITRREFWNHIHGLVNKGVTIMVTTHFMDEAEYCDRIALIYQGKVIKEATPDVLKASARSADMPEPTLADAFIKLIVEYDATHKNGTEESGEGGKSAPRTGADS